MESTRTMNYEKSSNDHINDDKSDNDNTNDDERDEDDINNDESYDDDSYVCTVNGTFKYQIGVCFKCKTIGPE